MKLLHNAIMPISQRPETIFVSGKGAYLFDEHGKSFLDFVQGWAVNTLGHCHPVLIEAIGQQAQQLINPSPSFYNQPMVQLANKLVEKSVFDQVFFANSGAEANEGAIKLARKWGQLDKNNAYKIICFDQGFHGRTLATMSASGKAGWNKLFNPKVDGFVKVPFNNLQAVNQAIDQQTVAIMLELIQGEAGVIPVNSEFILGLQAIAKEKNLLLIVDEIQTGIGRTGSLFCYQHFDIEPDIMTLGKGIGGGVPLAALMAKKSFCCFEPGDQGGTYNGNPLMTAAGLAVINEILKPGFLKQVNDCSQYLQQRLTEMSKQFQLGEIRGRGLLLALETGSLNAVSIANYAFERQLLINAPRANCLRFMPALTVLPEEIDLMIEKLYDAIAVLKEEI